MFQATRETFLQMVQNEEVKRTWGEMQHTLFYKGQILSTKAKGHGGSSRVDVATIVGEGGENMEVRLQEKAPVSPLLWGWE